MVAIETTNRCNAKCAFCPNSSLSQNRQTMSDELFAKIIEDCRQFELPEIEPFLNGEPFMDRQILSRMELIRRRLPRTKLRLYTNGYLMTPDKIDAMLDLGIDHLFVSLNTLDPNQYHKVMGLKLERTLRNLRYLTAPSRKGRVARAITFRMTRLHDTSFAAQKAFCDFSKQLGVRPFISCLYNYKGDVHGSLPVPRFPCSNITRVDILTSGKVTLCCMDQEGDYSWGDVTKQSVLDVYQARSAIQVREAHRTGRRMQLEPCDRCNYCSPSLSNLPLATTLKFGVEATWYFKRYKPRGCKKQM